MNKSVGPITLRRLISHGLYLVSGIPTRGTLAGLLVVAFMSLCGVARADIIYNVYVTNTGGTETVTGTITTDGNTGPLASGDITAWDLMATGVDTFTISSADSGSSFVCDITGCGLSASLADLSPATGTAYFEEVPGVLPGSPPPSWDAILFSENLWSATECVSTSLHCQVGPDNNYAEEGGLIASVPEPSSLAVLGLGLAGLGFARKRLRGRQATAV